MAPRLEVWFFATLHRSQNVLNRTLEPLLAGPGGPVLQHRFKP